MSASEEIQVNAIRKKGRRFYYYRWTDLKIPGRGGECSSGFTTKSKADEGKSAFRSKMIAERPRTEVTWAHFCHRYETEYLKKRRKSSTTAWLTAKNRFNEIVSTEMLADVTYDEISRFEGALRGTMADASVDTYLRTLKVALREAARLFPEYSPPKFTVKKCKPRVRPLTEDEMKAFLAAIEGVVGSQHARAWRFGARLASWTGLRRGQLMALSWDAHATIHVEDLDGPDPRIVIKPAASKGDRDHVIRLLPPAIGILRRVPAKHRKGKVWKPRRNGTPEKDEKEITRVFSAVGQAANIVTGTKLDKKTGGQCPRFASLHNTKATFIRRLADRGFGIHEIMEYAQHVDADTVLHYLKGASVSRARINELWAKHGHRKKPRLLKMKRG